MPILSSRIPVHGVRLPTGVYDRLQKEARALSARLGRPVQVHHLLERLAERAVATPAPTPGERTKTATSVNVRSLHAAGHCDRVIAERLGISVNLVIQHRRRMGLRVNPDPKRPEITVTDAYTARVVALARTGMPDQAIADQVGGSRETVRKLRCAAGIKRTPGRKPHTNNEGTAA